MCRYVHHPVFEITQMPHGSASGRGQRTVQHSTRTPYAWIGITCACYRRIGIDRPRVVPLRMTWGGPETDPV